MTQPSEGQARQEQLVRLQYIHKRLRKHEWFAVDSEFHFLVNIVDDLIVVLMKG